MGQIKAATCVPRSARAALLLCSLPGTAVRHFSTLHIWFYEDRALSQPPPPEKEAIAFCPLGFSVGLSFTARTGTVTKG